MSDACLHMQSSISPKVKLIYKSYTISTKTHMSTIFLTSATFCYHFDNTNVKSNQKVCVFWRLCFMFVTTNSHDYESVTEHLYFTRELCPMIWRCKKLLNCIFKKVCQKWQLDLITWLEEMAIFELSSCWQSTC